MKRKTSALVVENNRKLSTAFKEHLHKKVERVNVVPTIKQAQQEISQHVPDVIVIDLKAVREKNLFSFFHWLNKYPHLFQIPRLIINSSHQEALVQKLKSQGEAHFISKPIKVRLLLEQITTLIAQSSPGPEYPEFNPAALIGQQFGTALVQEEIGRGGMGIVYRGYQQALDRYVALKVLLPSMLSSKGAVDRFRREALAIAKIKSPYIVQVYDAGLTQDQIFFIIMEFLQGETLEELLKTSGKLHSPQAIEIISQVAQGLDVAHDSGLIHRDIKPSNLIVNPSGTVTITDFGLVRQIGDLKQTKTGTILGTPYYLSPEQASGKEIDRRSDIYSLGIVFYELLVGKPPHFSLNPLSLILKHLREPLPDPRQEVPDVPQPLVDILFRMTAKDTAQRYPDCRQLLSDLRALDTATRTMAFTGALTAATYSLEGQNLLVQFDEIFHQKLSHLKQLEPTQFSHNKLLGIVSVSRTGSVQKKEGDFPELWDKIVLIVFGIVPQIEVSSGQGVWKQAFLKTVEKTLAFFPRDFSIGAMLFDNERSSLGPRLLATSEMKREVPDQSSADPLSQMFSVVGVNGVVVFDQKGELIDHRLKEHFNRETVTLRLQPIPEIIRSLPISTDQFDYADFWFENGRVLLFHEGGKILVVFTELNLNISLLSILVSKVAEPLTSPSPTLKPGVGSDQISNPETTARIFKALRVEYARFIGPIAQIAIKKEVKKMGYTLSHFPEGKMSRLIDNLARNLTESKQEAFREKALDLLFSLGSEHQK